MNWTKFNIVLSVITIVVMGFVVLNPAWASSGCADKHENVSRFNPTELSDYQKCVFKWKGQEVGTIGEHIWMQHNGEFIYIKMDKLVGKSNAQVEQVIIKTVVDQAVKAELTQAQADLATMERLKLGAEADLKTLRDKIDALTNIAEASVKLPAGYTYQIGGGAIKGNETLDGAYNIVLGRISGPKVDGVWPFNKVIANVTLTNADSRELQAIMSNTTLMRAIHNLAAEIASDAYNQGYEDGYKAGYAAGYNAGIASVK